MSCFLDFLSHFLYLLFYFHLLFCYHLVFEFQFLFLKVDAGGFQFLFLEWWLMVHFLQVFIFLMFLCIFPVFHLYWHRKYISIVFYLWLGSKSYKVGVLCIGSGSRLCIYYILSWICFHPFCTVSMMIKLHFHWGLTHLYEFHFLYFIIGFYLLFLSLLDQRNYCFLQFL